MNDNEGEDGISELEKEVDRSGRTTNYCVDKAEYCQISFTFAQFFLKCTLYDLIMVIENACFYY